MSNNAGKIILTLGIAYLLKSRKVRKQVRRWIERIGEEKLLEIGEVALEWPDKTPIERKSWATGMVKHLLKQEYQTELTDQLLDKLGDYAIRVAEKQRAKRNASPT